MLKRLLLGLLLGLVLGGLMASAIVFGTGLSNFSSLAFGPLFAYAAAAVTGILVGLVAGKPIWAKGALIEAGLKAFFGAALGAGLLFAMRTWVPLSLALPIPHGGAGHVGDLPMVALPAIAALLAMFYEIDNTGDGKDEETGTKKRVASVAPPARIGEGEDAEAEDFAAAPKKQKR